MNLFDWLQNRWKSAAVHFIYERIGSSGVDGRSTLSSPIRSGEQYFRITLAEMFLKDDRDWFTDYSPAVYSVVKLRFGDKEETFSHVAGPSGLKDLRATSLNEGVTIDYPLTALMPFNGGDIELETGLVALPGSNDAKRLLKVLTDFSKTLAVPQLSIALGFAQPLVDGITELVGSDDTKLVLRLHDTFMQGGTLRPEYRVVINAPEGTLDPKQLWVKNDRLCYGVDAANGLIGYDYVLIRIDSVDERDDYHALSSIDEPYQGAISVLNDAILEPDPQKKKDKMSEAERLLGAAKLAAFKSKELTFKTGRRQVIQALQKGFEEAKQLLGSAAADQPIARNLSDAMIGAISPAEALLAGEVTIQDLLVEV
jgi:hypothetical protein